MSHYDCKSCGYDMGIDYGYCERCTPASVLNLHKELAAATMAANEDFKRSVETARAEYVESKTKALREKYLAEYKLYAPK